MLLSFETAATACALSLIGGIGSYLQGCRDERMKRSFFNASTEISMSISVGLAIMYLGEWREFPPPLTNFFILVLTNNGGDTLSKLKEKFLTLIANLPNLIK